jgi:predicted O-methyltransferase YrrM
MRGALQWGRDFTRTRFGENVDALRLARNDNRFVPTASRRPIWIRAKYQLLPVWLDYVAKDSAADWATSLETATYLRWLLQRLKPAHILDTGSGFSSYVFRLYQKEEEAERREISVMSVDDSEGWLEVTRTFLEHHQLSSDRLISWTDFQKREDKHFDFVFHDVGLENRISSIPNILHEATPDAPIIIDDGQFSEVDRCSREAARQAGRRLYSLRRYTLDEVGRYALLVSPVVASRRD